MLVQALATGAPSIRHAARHDSAGFLAQELERRRALRYPPFSHLIEIGLAGSDEARVETLGRDDARARRRSDLAPTTTCSARPRSSASGASTAAGW